MVFNLRNIKPDPDTKELENPINNLLANYVYESHRHCSYCVEILRILSFRGYRLDRISDLVEFLVNHSSSTAYLSILLNIRVCHPQYNDFCDKCYFKNDRIIKAQDVFSFARRRKLNSRYITTRQFEIILIAVALDERND